MSPKKPRDMTAKEYDEFIKSFDSIEQKIMMILRESRYIANWYPSYSSGAGDGIEYLMDELRTEWGLPEVGFGNWWWDK